MARIIRNDAVDDYIAYLKKIGAQTEELCGAAVYAMAKTVADKVRENIDALDAINDAENIKAYKAGEKARLTIGQKKGLQEGFGITPMEEDSGMYNVKLGFDGYNNVKTRKYPKGQPNVLIARSVESGTSIMDKQPFIRPAINKTRKTVYEEAQMAIDEKIYAIRREK